jgi:hypothetical protein
MLQRRILPESCLIFKLLLLPEGRLQWPIRGE